VKLDLNSGKATQLSQFNAGTDREGFRIEAQVKRQHLVVADRATVGLGANGS